MTLELKLDITPVSHQSARFTRGGIAYKPKKIKHFQKCLIDLVKEQLPKDFEIIKAGTPITVEFIEYVYEYPKSMPKKNKIGKVPKITKPDLQDNLNKAFFDSLEGIVFEQDQNIHYICSMRKYYDKSSKIHLKLNY